MENIQFIYILGLRSRENLIITHDKAELLLTWFWVLIRTITKFRCINYILYINRKNDAMYNIHNYVYIYIICIIIAFLIDQWPK
jgi:hypothetical protein